MEVTVNTTGLVIAVIASMVVGGIWYSMPVFGKAWIKLQGINEDVMKKGAAKAMLGMVIGSVLMAYTLAHVSFMSFHFFDGDYSFQQAALTSAFWMWLGFVVPVTSSNSLFNQAPWKLTFIHMFNWFFILLAMGLAIGQVGI
jgi:hypothetical protein